MWKASLVLVSVIACMLGACQGVSVAKSPMRILGSMNRYYVDTWDDSAEIRNTEDGISGQTILTGGTQKVVVLIHGREDSAGGEFAVRLREAFLNEDTTRTTAVIRVEWGAVTNLGYAFAVSAVPFVAEDLVEFLTALGAEGTETGSTETESMLNLENLHIVGFDLGAHVAGQTSRIVGAKKVTGLDPAGENWGQYSDRLRGTDAEYVEVIHTDGVGARAFGVGENLGGLNFFPNGGTRQPGCANSNNLCHHNRAWELYAATLEYPGGHLRGLRCDDLAQMSSNRCSGGPAVMGTSVLDKRETGIYRLVTGRVPPY